MAIFENDTDDKLITETGGNDYVENSGSQVTINTGGGNIQFIIRWVTA